MPEDRQAPIAPPPPAPLAPAGGLAALLDGGVVEFLQLQLCDLHGMNREVTVPRARFAQALAGELTVDGSAVGALAPAEAVDLRLRPDPDSAVLLATEGEAPVARAAADVLRPDGTPYEGDPRAALHRVLRDLAEAGYSARVAAESEYYLLQGGGAEPAPAPEATVAAAQRAVLQALGEAGVGVEHAYPEAGPGQQEVVLLDADPLRIADHLALSRRLIRDTALRHALRASWMPKPAAGWNGSGLHLRVVLQGEEGNAFADAESTDGLSAALRWFVGGVLAHARGLCAITNPLVNSYKRLVPSSGAPTAVAWSLESRASLVRIRAGRGESTCCEIRLPDGAANPYLALAALLAAGLAGIRGERDPGDPLNKPIELMSVRERQRLRIPALPRHLGEALDALEDDRLMRTTLGEYLYTRFVLAKRAEWDGYLAHVHPWEVGQYLER